MVVAVTGATGFVGKALVDRLMADGHEVRILTRNAISARLAMPNAALKGAKFYSWDTMKGKIEWYEAVKGCTGVVNLAGAPISSPWNAEYKKTLVKSRIVTTRRVVDAINALPAAERPTMHALVSRVEGSSACSRLPTSPPSSVARLSSPSLMRPLAVSNRGCASESTRLMRTPSASFASMMLLPAVRSVSSCCRSA